jgi:hypothetical protein
MPIAIEALLLIRILKQRCRSGDVPGDLVGSPPAI